MGIDPSTAYAAMDIGKIPCIEAGRRKIVPRAAFELMMAVGGKAFEQMISHPAVDLEQIEFLVKRQVRDVLARMIEMDLDGTTGALGARKG
jgi:hypothetical protein